MNFLPVKRVVRVCAGFILAIPMMTGIALAQSVQPIASFPGANDPLWLRAPYKGNDPYVHNGSEIEMEDRGDFIHITYTKPRPSLATLGIVKGTLLFSGRHEGDFVYGVAYTFKANCPPAAYTVRGIFDPQRNLVLVGNAPKRGFGCEIVGYSEFAGNNRLVFEETFGDE
jgi:hypothetical protein